MNNIYSVCKKSDIDSLTEEEKQIVLDGIIEDDINNLRQCLNEPIEVIMKRQENSPSPLDEVRVMHYDLTLEQAQALMLEPDWTPNEE